jgi:hypothetical protein
MASSIASSLFTNMSMMAEYSQNAFANLLSGRVADNLSHVDQMNRLYAIKGDVKY